MLCRPCRFARSQPTRRCAPGLLYASLTCVPEPTFPPTYGQLLERLLPDVHEVFDAGGDQYGYRRTPTRCIRAAQSTSSLLHVRQAKGVTS
jgi:hypothetical protein